MQFPGGKYPIPLQRSQGIFFMPSILGIIGDMSFLANLANNEGYQVVSDPLYLSKPPKIEQHNCISFRQNTSYEIEA
jgi:hypothetical protein